MRKKTLNHFGFTQFRFITAAVLLLAAALKVWQLSTVPLPPVVQDSVFTPLLELFNNRYLLMVVVLGEILFAFVLISGMWIRWAWLLTILCFSSFALVSFIKGLSGEASCGCFGTVSVNPWITTCFDIMIVCLLAVFRERIDGTFPPLNKKTVYAVLNTWSVFVGIALYGMMSFEEQTQTALGSEFIGVNGIKTITLMPENWIGKTFPLISHFTSQEGSDSLLQGQWNILLIHTDCPQCQQMTADIEKQNIERVAVVVVPSLSDEKMIETNRPVFVLNNHNNWYAETPYLIKLIDGICTSVIHETLLNRRRYIE